MAATSSSKTAVDEAPQEDYVWIELRLLQSIFVQSRLGQTVLKFVDNFLWGVEKCMEWSLPRQEVGGEENRKGSGKQLELVRPLPWLLFLPSLVLLRVIRMTVNIGASVLSYPINITPSGMVKFMQICRRYLNTAMAKEMKERYDIKDKRPSINEAKKALIRSIRLTLSSLSCLDASKPSLSPPPTKIYVSSILDPDPVTTTSEEKSVTDSMDSTVKLKDSMSESEKDEKKEKEEKQAEEKQQEEEEEEEEEKEKETLNEKIDRLAAENSEDDEDFDPDKYSNDASNDEDEGENSDDSMSSNEVRNLQKSYSKMEENIEQFLYAERSFASAPQQISVEPVYGKRSSAKESRDKVEERLATSQRIDSPECYTPDRSSQEGDPIFYSPISSDSDAPKDLSVSIAEQCAARKVLKTNEFINGEARFISASTTSESKLAGEINNGAVVQKRSTNVSKSHKGKPTNHGNRKKKIVN